VRLRSVGAHALADLVARSMAIMRGPMNSAIASAVIAARMPRSVRYWNT
jgi:hypothetical protein